MGKPPRKALRILKGGHKYEIVHLAHLAAALVDGADLCLQNKQRRGRLRQGRARMRSHKIEGFRLHSQPIQPGFFIELKLLGQFCPPLRMRKIARAQHVDALAAGPCRQMTGIERLACGARKPGMYMQIGDKVHNSPCGHMVQVFVLLNLLGHCRTADSAKPWAEAQGLCRQAGAARICRGLAVLARVQGKRCFNGALVGCIFARQHKYPQCRL